MGILFPSFFGLSIFIAGLIIFYMFKKEYTQQVVSSNLLWKQVMNEWQATKWWKKLQRQLLLLLQILFLFFLMLALARPYVSSEGIEGEHVIIIIDSSASMATVIDEIGTTRFAKAKQETLSLLEKRSRDQAVSIISLGAKPTLVMNRELNEKALKKTVEELTISYEYGEVKQALSLAKALSQQQSASIYVFSDRITEDDWKESQIQLPFQAINIDTKKNDNISIITFGVNTNREKTTGVVTLKNESSQTQQVTLQFMADKQIAHTEVIAIDANSQAYATVEALPPATYYRVKIVEEDQFSLDNVAYAFSSIESKSVLYLIGDINPFLQKVFIHLGHEIIQAEKLEDIREFRKNSIIVATLASPELNQQIKELRQPLFLLASTKEEVLPLKNKIETKRNEELFAYADVNELFVSQARRQKLPNNKLIETIMLSGDVPLIQKGEQNGHRFVQLLFAIQDSDWSLQPSFPIFVYHTLDFLKGESTHLGYFTANEERQLPLETPGIYKLVDESETVIATFDSNSENFQAPQKPGLYYLLDNEGQKKYLAVTLDDREKEIQAQSSFSKGGAEATMMINNVQSEWWPWLLLVAFIILLIEWEVYRRGIRV